VIPHDIGFGDESGCRAADESGAENAEQRGAYSAERVFRRGGSGAAGVPALYALAGGVLCPLLPVCPLCPV